MLETARDGFAISADSSRLDLDAVERLIRASYWASSRPRDVIEKSLEHSLCYGLYEVAGGTLVGFMRVVTDYATFAWLCDVMIDEPYRGQGLGRWMLQTVLDAEATRTVRRWILATRDAHPFYADYGFVAFAQSERWMELIRA